MNFNHMSISDLAWKLVPLYGGRAEIKTVSDIKREDRFVMASQVSQREFLRVENLLQRYFEELDFVELSPLQPLGLNCVLANTNGKKLIPTVRGQEVNSDATTALFLEAYRRYGGEDLRLATNVRTVRPKVFSEESKFLTHFKVFAEVSIGRQSHPFGLKDVATIIKHLTDEVGAIVYILSECSNSAKELRIYISDFALLGGVFSGGFDNGKNTVDEVANFLASSNLPKVLPIDEQLLTILSGLGFVRGMKILEMTLGELSRKYVEPSSKIAIKYFLDLSRSAGFGYYKHIVYKITAVDDSGLELPLADGGSNDWGSKMLYNKQIYTVSSGIGTEILIQNYLKPVL